MMRDPRADLPRIAIFCDGVGLWSLARTLGFDVDFKLLLSHFGERGHVVGAHYYTPLPRRTPRTRSCPCARSSTGSHTTAGG
jgi:hypothetical protein